MKKGMKIGLGILAGVIVLSAIAGGGNEDEPKSTTTLPTTVITTTIATTIPTTIQTTKETTKETAISSSDEVLIESTKNLFIEAFKDSSTVEVDKENKYFLLTPIDDGLLTGAFLAKNGDKENLDKWEALVESLRNLSENLTDSLPGYSIVIVNSQSPDHFLLIIQDGFVLYDAVNEK